MVAGLAFVATAVATLFAEATFKRWRQGRRPHEAAWAVALAAGIAVIYAGFLVAARPSNVSDHRGVSEMTSVGAQPV